MGRFLIGALIAVCLTGCMSEQERAARDACNADPQCVAQRNAMLMQLLGSGALRTPQPYQLPMPQAPVNRTTNCTTSFIGNQAYTQCN